MTARIVIIGVGNLLKGDDGFGVRVIEALDGENLPEGVECIDGGTGGPTLMIYFEGAEALILIDAVNLGGAAPGTLRTFSLDEVAEVSGRTVHMGSAPFSLHDLGVMPMLDLARKLGSCPPVVRFVGVQPESFDQGDRLTPAVEAAVPDAVKMVLVELQRLNG